MAAGSPAGVRSAERCIFETVVSRRQTMQDASYAPYVHKNQKETSMAMIRKFIALVGMSLVVGTVSTAAFAVSKRTAPQVRSDVAQLLRAMDKDMNGAVSKDEFLQFMGQMFDRFDINRSNQLEPRELSNVSFGADKRTVAEARRLLRVIDKDMNGTVSRDEFLQFMGRTFDRLDINRSGELEARELRALMGNSWDRGYQNDPADHPF
jgi:Ca2+-binding EF-hand superfamily protein